MFSRSFFRSLGMLASLPYAFMSVVGMRVGDRVGGWRGVGPLPPVGRCDLAVGVGLVCTETVH